MDFESIKALFNDIVQAFNKCKEFYNENKEYIFAIFNAFLQLPAYSKIAGDEWVKYGWVPFLPDSDLVTIAEALEYPKTREEADERMASALEKCTYDVLFQNISDLLNEKENNLIMFDESVFCFKKQKYTSCVLNLFSIIDACFVDGQPKVENKSKRKLSRSAVNKMFENEDEQNYILIMYAVIGIIKETFKDAKDFSIQEDKLYRNFVSHGMNKRVVSKMDCEKMFILLYNTLSLFDAGLFNWDKFKELQPIIDENVKEIEQ